MYLVLVNNESKKMNRKKQYFKVLIAFYSLLIFIFFSTCQKIDLTREALVQTNSFNLGTGAITLTGTIIDLGEGISDHGFIVSITPNPSISNGVVLSLGAASQTGQFTYDVSEVAGGTNFYFRAFATSGGETIYGESSNFSTPALVVSTQTATIRSKSSAILNGVISDLGFESVTEHGFFWADDPSPQNFPENRIRLGAATEATIFNSTLTGLTPYEEYFFVAYAQNASGFKFGNVGSFKIENVWTRIGNFSGSARYRALAFSLEDIGYITGGQDTEHINDFYQFNPDSETWTFISSGNSPVNGADFTIGNKAYIIDGRDLYEFDPDEGMWVSKTPFSGSDRYEKFAFSIGNKGYVGGGGYWDGTQHIFLSDFWEFDPQDDITNGTDINGNPMGSWTQEVDFPGTGRLSGEGFSIANFGYVCSGYNSGYLDDFWQYDPDSNVWSQKTDYPGPPGTAMVSFIIDNKAYVFNYELWQYDLDTEIWTKMADFPGQSRYAPAGFAINNKGYVGIGVYNDSGTDIYMDDFWEYLPFE